MAHRHRERADERTMGRVEHVALHRPADRVRAVEHGDRKRTPGRRPHHFDGGAEVGEGPGAHVREVHQQEVDPRQHRIRGRALRTVKAVDWKTGCAVAGGRDGFAGGGGAAESVLGTEQGDQPDPGFAQAFDITGAGRVDPALIGHQTDSLPPHQVQTVADQDIDAGQHPGRYRARPAGRGGSASNQNRHQDFQLHVTSSALRIRMGLLVLLLGAPGSLAAQASPRPPAEVARLLRTLPLRDRIAQLVMPWIPGTYAAFDDAALAEVTAWVDSLRIGGIVVSIGSPLDIAAKLNFLQRQSRLPLLIASDLEAGTSIRFHGGTPFPTNMGVGATGSESDAYAMGRITALEGRAAGIHLTFSPVADVNNNPANPIINTRAFGSDPIQVARLVAAAVQGTEEGGMLATAKHFPGHGDTDIDSHIALPVIRADWRRLQSLELVPFQAAIAAGASVVMSAHVALPGLGLDAARPATLAPEVLTGILRDSLGFRGLVVTDALNMGALVNQYGPGEAAVQAMIAGTDILLMPTNARPRSTRSNRRCRKAGFRGSGSMPRSAGYSWPSIRSASSAIVPWISTSWASWWEAGRTAIPRSRSPGDPWCWSGTAWPCWTACGAGPGRSRWFSIPTT